MTVCERLAPLSIRTRGGTVKTRVRLGKAGGRSNSICGFRSPVSTFSKVKASFASLSGRSNGPPSWSWTHRVSSAMPFDIVTIFASTILAPETASAPAMRENRPGWSAV